MSIAPGWGGKSELKKEIEYLKAKIRIRDKQHAAYEKAMKRMEQEKSRLKKKNNNLIQKLRSICSKIQSARSLLDNAFYPDDLDYDIQGVNQAHRVLSGGKPPRETNSGD